MLLDRLPSFLYQLFWYRRSCAENSVLKAKSLLLSFSHFSNYFIKIYKSLFHSIRYAIISNIYLNCIKIVALSRFIIIGFVTYKSEIYYIIISFLLMICSIRSQDLSIISYINKLFYILIFEEHIIDFYRLSHFLMMCAYYWNRDFLLSIDDSYIFFMLFFNKLDQLLYIEN